MVPMSPISLMSPITLITPITPMDFIIPIGLTGPFSLFSFKSTHYPYTISLLFQRRVAGHISAYIQVHFQPE